MMVAVALLAMALAAAAGHRSTLAVVAAGVCAAVAITGLVVFESTVHRDHIDHHETPHLLSDSYVPVPPWVRRARGRFDEGGR
ncbi:hypothetical protein IU500_32495 [Nocardia terpenica]|uniref:Uncharacterized protein n=2 Tax=Nocardia terpenica TaxID=455432 RepID=A0A291RK97_9NOCA|nr:hypothetical protein [Nocardia terpenica]ATL67718.1 hypothetical protein CRH09_17460 [Nocardia terpenica]MBF6061050.1 hypothetical protein [Nocardia terpenica]MBF6108738.1 hypothetical protein [Nocardia terpenica]MBF6114076.1 hypothetical protein [Nocardia terpenica]MBF6120300.1 hypothetical protein [Nocardia terpenica]